jgi:alkylhydroperoxidase family enzyme
VQQLRDFGWTNEQIAEAVHVAAMMGLCNRVANAFGLPAQGFLDLRH